jgi:hypothetical protein
MGAMHTEQAGSGARVTIVVPGPGEQPNLGVSDLELGSAMVAAGSATRFSIEATNYGREDARNVTVGLSIDGEAPSDQAVISAIPAGESRRVSLYGKTGAAGYHAVTAQLAPDHLVADDRRTMVVRAMDEARVLLVAGEMGATPREGDAFYLERALAPVPVEDRDRYFVKTRTVAAEELSGQKFEDFDAVALVDVPGVDAGTAAALEKYVREGGGLMIFPGEKVDAAAYNTTLGEGMGLLPALMGTAWGDAAEQTKFRSFEAAGYTHPMVSIWQDRASGTLATARFFKGVPLEPLRKQSDLAGDAVTVVGYQDGTPAIVERTWGSGRVIEFSSTATTAWNDLPARPAFVPLMQRALGRLVTRRDEALNIPVGGTFTYPAQPEWLYKEMRVSQPGAAPGSGDVSNVGLIGGEPLLRYGDTDHAGVYEVAIDSEPRAKLRFAAEADPEESKLAALPDAELKMLAPGTAVIHWDPETDMRKALAWAGNGREFWTVFAVLALGVACCETFLAGRFSASK